MARIIVPAIGSSLLALAGCVPDPVPPPGPPPSPPAESRPSPRDSTPSPIAGAKAADISWDTDKDRTFAEFLRDHSGGMIKKAAVGVDRSGMLRVELDRSVAPDETLDLTKSLMNGARKDFPDRPITLAVFDPNGDPILKARYKPGQGINYEIAHESKGTVRRGSPDDAPSSAPRSADPASKSGVTEADRKFAAWAEEHGKSYLRYVEADLERHGRLWFGVTREVKPADVPQLTKSLLEGARKEFPSGELVANVFDPEGERIGKAHLTADGKVRWEH